MFLVKRQPASSQIGRCPAMLFPRVSVALRSPKGNAQAARTPKANPVEPSSSRIARCDGAGNGGGDGGGDGAGAAVGWGGWLAGGVDPHWASAGVETRIAAMSAMVRFKCVLLSRPGDGDGAVVGGPVRERELTQRDGRPAEQLERCGWVVLGHDLPWTDTGGSATGRTVEVHDSYAAIGRGRRLGSRGVVRRQCQRQSVGRQRRVDRLGSREHASAGGGAGRVGAWGQRSVVAGEAHHRDRNA